VSCNHLLKKSCGCASVEVSPSAGDPAAHEVAPVEPPVNRKPASVAHIAQPNLVPWSPAGRAAAAAREAPRPADPTEALLATLEEMLENPDPEVRARAEEEVAKAIDRQLAKDYFADYARQAWKVIEPGTRFEWNWHHELICWVLQALFLAWQRGTKLDLPVEIRNVVFNLPPGSAKPCDINGVVQEKTRGLVPLASIQIGDQVLTHRGRYRSVENVFEQGVLPIVEFTTARGRKIRVAPDHPMLTQRGWVAAEDVTTRDVFAEIHSTESSGTRTILLEEARMIGYLVGDGCVSQTQAATFTNADPETVADFVTCCEALGFEGEIKPRPPSQARQFRKPTNIVSVKGGHGTLAGVPRSERKGIIGPVRQWVRDRELEKKSSYTKRVPAVVMQGDDEVVAEYLAAYWACDGGIEDRRDLPRAGREGQTTQSVRVAAVTVSEGLARDHQALLQRLGLSFTLRKKVSNIKTKRQGDTYDSWLLSASDQDVVAKFMQIVAPRIRHEKSRRAPGTARSKFDQILNEDPVREIRRVDGAECRCLQIEEDASFVYQGVAVHNSRLLSVFFPTWIWTHCPSFKIICLSVNETAAMRDARASRDLLKSDWYQISFQPDWRIKDDQDSVSDYANTQGGGRLSRASGSEIVGLRGDLILMDDPNNPFESESKKVRDEVNDLWDANQYNRVNSSMRSLRIGVQQRTHTADWTGHVLDLQGTWAPERPEGWLHIPIPAEFERERKFTMPEPLIRVLREAGFGEEVVYEDPRVNEGESVHPSRWPLEWLVGERKRMRDQYPGQMQQRPVAAGGGKVKHSYLSFCRLASGVHPLHDEIGTGHGRPSKCNQTSAPYNIPVKWQGGGVWDLDWIMISIDPANQKTENGSNWGLLVIGAKGGRRFVLDDRSQRGDVDEILDIIIEMIRYWKADKVLIEKKAAGPTLLMMLRKILEQGALGKLVDENGVPMMVDVDEVLPDALGGKMDRLMAVLPVIKAGLLYLLDGAEWLEDWVQEVTGYPNVPRDDRIDCLSQGLAHAWASEIEYPDF
jgi:predicted phage terminase large subunit-like protein